MVLYKPERHKTALQHAYHTIKQGILVGNLKPGEHIDQDRLAEEIGVSRVPIRSALERLASHGLVRIVPQRGAIVMEMGREELLQLYALREHIEPWVVRLSHPRLTAGDRRQLRELLEQGRRAIQTGHWEEYPDLNQEFHQVIHRATGNDLLIPILEQLWDRAMRYRWAYMKLSELGAESLQLNFQLLEALESGTVDEAADLMLRLLDAAKQKLLEAMASGTIADQTPSAK